MICNASLDSRNEIKLSNYNDIFESIFGGSVMTLDALIPQQKRDKRLQNFKDSISDNKDTVFITDLKVADDNEKSFQIIYKKSEVSNSGFLFIHEYASVAINDIQRAKIEALGSLSGGIAHDFNNVLSIISGYSQLILDKGNEFDDVSKDYFEKITTATKRGASLTRQLLAFSKQKIMLEKTDNVVEQLSEQINFMQPLLGSMVNLHFKADEESLFIKTAPDILNQIIMNILVNARDAMPSGGDVFVNVSGPVCLPDTYRALHRFEKVEDQDNKTFVQIEIKDTGSGIDKKIAKRIFDPFFTTKEQGKGTGLGLSTVHGLVTQLNGIIDFETEIGVGTKFILFFPLVDSAKNVAHPTFEDAHLLIGKTILVVEDEQDFSDVMTNIFKKVGMNVLTASNGNEALYIQDEFDGAIDFCLSDIVMPEMHGGQLGQMLEVLRPDTNIIYMSGYAGRGTIDPKELPDIDEIIPKPLDVNKILSLMHKMVKGAPKEEIQNFYKTIN